MNSTKYCGILKEGLLPYAKEQFKSKYIYQQDNAPIHTSALTKKIFKKEKIKVMDWPSKSPDLNPMENMWGILARKVYKQGKKQFSTKEQLQKAIFKEWSKIDLKECQKLVKTMPTCLAKVVRKGGRVIDY